MRTADLPVRLDMHQALAWVRYRDALFALSADADALQAETTFGSRPLLAGRDQLKAALLVGDLRAWGAMPGTDWITIPAPEWLELDIAPRDPARQSPYLAIQLKRDDLLRVFPDQGCPRSRPSKQGSGSMEPADLPHLEAMAELIRTAKAVSPNGAAQIVARDAPGRGTLESKATRLAKRFRAWERNGRRLSAPKFSDQL